MDSETNKALYMEWLETRVFELMEQEASTKPWTQVDKTKLPKGAFLWIVDPDKKSTWKLPYREGAGGIDSDTGMYIQAGPVNLGALRAIAVVLGGARTGTPMTVPPEIKSKITKLLKKYKIGKFKENRDMVKTGIEITEQHIGNQYAPENLDKENCIVRNVAVLGPSSNNKVYKESIGRKYSRRARESAVGLVTGIKAYINHVTKKELEERGGVRDVKDILGYHQNARLDEDGIVRSDLRYLENHKIWFEPLVETMADKIGNSIHASGDAAFDRDTKYEIVENITGMRSVDLVTDVGSTKSLFESLNRGETMEYDKITIAELKENRPDLFEKMETEMHEQLDEKGKVKKLETELAETKVKVKEQTGKLDEYEVKEKAAKKEGRILELIEESELSKDYVTDPFMESLRSAKDDEAIKGLIEDRKKIVEVGKSGGVKGMGEEKVVLDEKGNAIADVAWKKELKEGIKS